VGKKRQGILDSQSCALKMIVAIALILESGGQSSLGHRLFESVREKAERTLLSGSVELKKLSFLVLMVSLDKVS